MMEKLVMHMPELVGIWLFSSICGSQLQGQCTTSYTDQGSDGTYVSSWDALTDNYTDAQSYCAPQSWGAFTHSYSLTLNIASPSGGSNYGTGGGSASYGQGAGYATVSVALPLYLDNGDIDTGTWSVWGDERIDCSVAGYGFFQNAVSRWFAVGSSVNVYDPKIDDWVDQDLYRHCLYQKKDPCVVYCPWSEYAERVIFNWEACSPRAIVQIPYIRFGASVTCVNVFGRAGPYYNPVDCYNFEGH